MTDDATLSDFGVGTGEDSDADSRADEIDSDSRADETDDGSDADPPAADIETATDRSDSDEPHASLATYAWGEYTCSRCGSDSDRVWRDDGEFVCSDCKEW